MHYVKVDMDSKFKPKMVSLKEKAHWLSSHHYRPRKTLIPRDIERCDCTSKDAVLLSLIGNII